MMLSEIPAGFISPAAGYINTLKFDHKNHLRVVRANAFVGFNGYELDINGDSTETFKNLTIEAGAFTNVTCSNTLNIQNNRYLYSMAAGE